MKFDVSFDVTSSDTRALHDHVYEKFGISDIIPTYHCMIITRIIYHECMTTSSYVYCIRISTIMLCQYDK